MKISCRWLEDYVDLPVSPEELAVMLTMGGLEVEAVDRIGEIPNGVVVGRVLDVQDHPNADRLTVCTVDVGESQPLQIVCGAPNVAKGQNVPLAMVGSSLRMPDPNDPARSVTVEIGRTSIRGVESAGMICAEDELGLSDDHSGIMVLAGDAVAGSSFEEYLESHGDFYRDTVLDIAITPNRPDAACHVGVARDVAALTGGRWRLPEVEVPADAGEASSHIAISIEDDTLCRRYAGVVVQGVSVGESPEWLKRRLEAVGLRPRNNLVDVTNYVMYECGQPLHAFDLDEVAGARIIVRPTPAPSRFTTLDGEMRELPAGTLMICDADREVAIAGVMGGRNSEVTRDTANVLIESAWFSPKSIRRTSKALGLQTDASYRFERGVDSGIQAWAAMRAAMLIVELAGGEVVPGVVDEHPNPIRPPHVELRMSRIREILGIDVPKDEAVRLLEQIGFVMTEEAGDAATFAVPTHRPDVEREIDLIEEIARLYGYDRIDEPATTPVPSFTPRDRKEDLARQTILGLAGGWGYREIYANSLLPEERAVNYCDPVLLGDLWNGTPVTTANPISREMTTLRPSLLPGALEVIRHNLNHGRRSARVIEFGNVFTRQALPENVIAGYEEHESLLLACAGSSGDRHWSEADRPLDFFDVKGAVSSILSVMGVDGVTERASYEQTPITQHSVDFLSGGVRMGVAATLHPDRGAKEDIDVPVHFAELNWSRLLERSSVGVNTDYRLVSRFPTVERDLAFVVAGSQNVGPMIETVRSEGAPLLADVGVFDVFEGRNLGAGRKSVAFSLRFSADRTLTDDEVDRQVRRIVDAICRLYGAELRE